MNNHRGTTLEKALEVNLDPRRYGTFAEIGAGQEVVRWFFQAGGAAGTISKSISAYDMQVSDAIYGKCKRYVCRERLEAMLDHEQTLNRDRLEGHRGAESTFFCFADTVSARNYHGTNECHGWMGVQFQAEPGAADSRIIIHVRMLDNENAQQQDAIGIAGVNLVHAAFFAHDDPDQLIESLLDGLSTQRIEIDMIEFSGAAFSTIDNRIMALKLVQKGMTGAALFAADGSVLQPSAVLRKRPLLVERGRFRPVTNVNIDMMHSTLAAFEAAHGIAEGETLPIMELSMNCLAASGEVNLADFIDRAEVLESTGHTVMISDYYEYFRLAQYLFRFTQKPI
ncbi:MAG: TonB-dependent receptor, partial [Gammaproteobacteria bacterium]|nr:TonB-dependent receptor [Gammaproteobacteria bacterium]